MILHAWAQPIPADSSGRDRGGPTRDLTAEAGDYEAGVKLLHDQLAAGERLAAIIVERP